MDRRVKGLAKAARALGPRAADLGSNAARDVPDVEFAAGLVCDAPAAAPLVRGSPAALPFQSGAFTGVLAAGAASAAAAREMARVLQPGGFAVVGGDLAAWDPVLVAAGFDVECVGDVLAARRPGGDRVEIPKPSLASMFVPRRWLDRRRS